MNITETDPRWVHVEDRGTALASAQPAGRVSPLPKRPHIPPKKIKVSETTTTTKKKLVDSIPMKDESARPPPTKAELVKKEKEREGTPLASTTAAKLPQRRVPGSGFKKNGSQSSTPPATESSSEVPLKKAAPIDRELKREAPSSSAISSRRPETMPPPQETAISKLPTIKKKTASDTSSVNGDRERKRAVDDLRDPPRKRARDADSEYSDRYSDRESVTGKRRRIEDRGKERERGRERERESDREWEKERESRREKERAREREREKDRERDRERGREWDRESLSSKVKVEPKDPGLPKKPTVGDASPRLPPPRMKAERDPTPSMRSPVIPPRSPALPSRPPPPERAPSTASTHSRHDESSGRHGSKSRRTMPNFTSSEEEEPVSKTKADRKRRDDSPPPKRAKDRSASPPPKREKSEPALHLPKELPSDPKTLRRLYDKNVTEYSRQYHTHKNLFENFMRMLEDEEPDSDFDYVDEDFLSAISEGNTTATKQLAKVYKKYYNIPDNERIEYEPELDS